LQQHPNPGNSVSGRGNHNGNGGTGAGGNSGGNGDTPPLNTIAPWPNPIGGHHNGNHNGSGGTTASEGSSGPLHGGNSNDGNVGTSPSIGGPLPGNNPDTVTALPIDVNNGNPGQDKTGAIAAPVDSSTKGVGSAYVVASGDTLSGIAAAHGMPLASLEQLNPQIKNPDMIFSGQTINLDGPDKAPMQSVGTGGIAAAPDAGFPQSSTYPPPDSNTDKALGGKLKNLSNKLKGWGMGNVSPDPAQNTVYVSSERNTNPLNIKDEGHSSH
jgi:LysM repeat protein